MTLVVQKYGGSSVADAAGVRRVADRIVAQLTHATLIVLGCTVLSNLAGRLRESSVLNAARRIDVLGSLAFSALVTSLAAGVWIVVTSYGCCYPRCWRRRRCSRRRKLSSFSRSSVE